MNIQFRNTSRRVVVIVRRSVIKMLIMKGKYYCGGWSLYAQMRVDVFRHVDDVSVTSLRRRLRVSSCIHPPSWCGGWLGRDWPLTSALISSVPGWHVCVWRACLWCTYTPWVASRRPAWLRACVRACDKLHALARAGIDLTTRHWSRPTRPARVTRRGKKGRKGGLRWCWRTTVSSTMRRRLWRDERRARTYSAVGDTGSRPARACQHQLPRVADCRSALFATTCVLSATTDVRWTAVSRCDSAETVVQSPTRADVLVISLILCACIVACGAVHVIRLA